MKELLTRYQRDLALKGYSPKTCEHYFSNVKQFISHCQIDAPRIDPEIIKDYLYYLITEKNASDSKIRQAHSAIRYLVIQTLSQPWSAGAIPHIKKKKRLPVVYSVPEVFAILDNAANLKHRIILSLVYSSGLRVSEVVKLAISDIKRDQKRLPAQFCHPFPGMRRRYFSASEIPRSQKPENHFSLRSCPGREYHSYQPPRLL